MNILVNPVTIFLKLSFEKKYTYKSNKNSLSFKINLISAIFNILIRNQNFCFGIYAHLHKLKQS